MEVSEVNRSSSIVFHSWLLPPQRMSLKEAKRESICNLSVDIIVSFLEHTFWPSFCFRSWSTKSKTADIINTPSLTKFGEFEVSSNRDKAFDVTSTNWRLGPWAEAKWRAKENKRPFASFEPSKRREKMRKVAWNGNFVLLHTVRNLHFLSKNSTLILGENCRFFWVKISWKCCGFGLFSCWQLGFHEKNCQKKIWVKNSWKCWGFVKIEFVDKNWTFRIVWPPFKVGYRMISSLKKNLFALYEIPRISRRRSK